MTTSSESSVIVVGAGVIGLATAVELAARGFKVTVLDPAPASGATHFAGGMLAPAAEVVYQQDPLFPLMRASGAWYPELIDLVAAHTEVPTGYRAEGTLVIAADRADAQHLTELADYQSLHGMEVERITMREARRAEPLLSPRLAGAVSIPGDTQVFPRQWTAALISAAQALGVRFFRTAAQSIDAATGVVSTPAGQFHADDVVLAAGLGARDIDWAASAGLHRSPLHLRPVYGDILRLRVPDELQPLLTRVVRGFVEDRPIYLIPRGDGTLAVGATTREDTLATAQAGGVYALLRDAIRILPAIEECEFLEASAGARPGTPDDLPYLGRVSDKLVISTGYFRHGILLTALAARCTRELIEGTEPSIDLTACDPLRHLKEQQ
ncbi:glycine oxidase ThiO [Corynebacterium sp. HMSC070E08]|uniref:glycine oxidase ThiO n=1 Tax=Corynebacterium sp. HMSC070E08 TaxID=1715006 RepID=UPI0008A46566|nr:glycine oxidase ThiO [Corynebacterium sp. HMSC070E08]OFN76730.1 glycine oxidase ThiO [Corynebacterium sp. HMSC070E08]